MAKRWTPQRMKSLRRIRVTLCAVIAVLAVIATFFVANRKAVALTVNGQTRHITTFANTIPGVLREQHVDLKTHDVVQSTSANEVRNHDVISVKSAYQTTISIDGQEVPFWTVADSATQLIDFFEQNEVQASRVTVDIKNVYNKLTGGMVINRQGPVTVIADGKTSQAPNGKLPAASILDSKGIVLKKDDRVQVRKDADATILQVQRVTYGEKTETKDIPFTTRTVLNDQLEPGTSRIAQQGVNGVETMKYKVTYVDGKEESKTLIAQSTTTAALDQVVEVGPEKQENEAGTTDNSKNTDDSDTSEKDTANKGTEEDSKEQEKPKSETDPADDSNSGSEEPKSSEQPAQTEEPKPTEMPTQQPSQEPQPTQSAEPSQEPTQKPVETPKPEPKPTQTQKPEESKPVEQNPAAGSRLYRPSPSAAQAYAAGAAAQYGWTGSNWENLVKLWNRESSWLWYAENPDSGAYGIPQALPASQMAGYGDYRNDAAAQIDWGLSYIAGRYGSPNNAWAHSEKFNWY